MIKKKLLEARLKNGLSQEELADLIGLTQPNYSRRESGTTKITKMEWSNLAKALDKSLDEIYEPEDSVDNLTANNTQTDFAVAASENNVAFLIETMKKNILILEAELKKNKNEI